jgi:hypothetical protein
MAVTVIKLNKDKGRFLNLKYVTSYTDRESTNLRIALYLCDENFEPLCEDKPSLLFKEMSEEDYHKTLRSGYSGFVVEEQSSNPEWNINLK